MLLSLVQTYALVYSNRRVQDHWMYALIFSVDVHRGTTRRMLADSTSYSMNSIRTYGKKYQMYATLWYTHWIIPEHMR